jgi:hypothetical protein
MLRVPAANLLGRQGAREERLDGGEDLRLLRGLEAEHRPRHTRGRAEACQGMSRLRSAPIRK